MVNISVRLINRSIEDFNLDLKGYKVFTEAAKGPYLYTPILAAVAGAEKVYAITNDSEFGTKESVAEETLKAASELGVEERIAVVFTKDRDHVKECDIFTNSGFVRPITAEMISWMKPTAVIPLMWETWEFRESDLDLDACRKNNILVLGTGESKKPIRIYSYTGELAKKLISNFNFKSSRPKILLLGSGKLGKSIYTYLKKIGFDTTWFSASDRGSMPYRRLHDHFLSYKKGYDIILVAEHQHNALLLGREGILPFEVVRKINPSICIGVISGNIDSKQLMKSGLRYYPEKIRPFGYMSYDLYQLGEEPVLKLYAAGLKVAETMARCRLKAMGLQETVRYSLQYSPAQDFVKTDPGQRTF